MGATTPSSRHQKATFSCRSQGRPSSPEEGKRRDPFALELKDCRWRREICISWRPNEDDDVVAEVNVSSGDSKIVARQGTTPPRSESCWGSPGYPWDWQGQLAWLVWHKLVEEKGNGLIGLQQLLCLRGITFPSTGSWQRIVSRYVLGVSSGIFLLRSPSSRPFSSSPKSLFYRGFLLSIVTRQEKTRYLDHWWKTKQKSWSTPHPARVGW